jgi:hypothetical protein
MAWQSVQNEGSSHTPLHVDHVSGCVKVESVAAVEPVSNMRILLLCMGLILALGCVSQPVPAATQAPSHEVRATTTVTGKLMRVVAIGGESTGWAIALESDIIADGKQVSSVEIDFARTKKLERLEDQRVTAVGTITHRHGVETGERLVLEVASLKAAKAN